MNEAFCIVRTGRLVEPDFLVTQNPGLSVDNLVCAVGILGSIELENIKLDIVHINLISSANILWDIAYVLKVVDATED